MKARLALLATISVVAVLNACGDPTNLRATIPTSVDTLSLWALSGTPPTYPSGVSIVGRQAIRVDAGAAFDVAFDINADGNPVIYPVKLIVSTPGGSRPVGLLRVPGEFDSVTVAPSTGYEADSALVLSPGEVIAIQAAHNQASDFCQFAISPNIYAKIAVDSVNLDSRILYFRLGLDPNCGFRSFAEGLPPN
jgi:hypothetical protein